MAFLPEQRLGRTFKNLLEIETTYEQYKLYWRCLNDQRKEGLLCDAVIHCRGSTYHAHKCVLASASPYFKALFSSSFCVQTDHQQIAKLDQFSEASIALLLDVIYDQAKVEDADIAEMLKLADFLQYDWLLNQLVEAIRITLDDANCFHWYEIAKVCGIDKLSVLAESYIRINYEKLLAMDEYTNLAQAMERDCFFDKDIVFYCSYKSFYVIDAEKKSCVKYKDGPCCVSDIEPTIGHMNILQDFSIISCFTYKKELFVVTSFQDRMPAISFGETNIEIYMYKQLFEEYTLVSRMKQFHILYDEHLFREYVKYEELASWRAEHGGFTLQQAAFDNRSNLYLLFASSKIDEVVINKFSIIDGRCSDNYIRLHVQVSDTKFHFVECKHFGYLLMQGLELVYVLDEFNFEDRGRGNWTVEELKMKPNKDGMHYEPLNGMWNVVSLNGDIYYFGIFQNNNSKLSILKLNTEKLSWDHLNDFSISGGLTNAFCCQGKMFLVLSSIQYGNYCCCTDGDCLLNHYKTEDVYEHVCYYDPVEVTLTSINMKLPLSDVKNYRAFTLPAHVLV